MTATVPQTRWTREDWLQGYQSQNRETAGALTEIEGSLPPELCGTFFRNGPGKLEIGGETIHHPFDGDGMITAIGFREGRAWFRNRYVRTEGFLAEQKAERILYRGVFGTRKPGGPLANAFDLKLKNIANTNVLYWGDRLLALWEAAEPHRLDPQTLDTFGLDDLDGLLASGEAFSAHPRIDPGEPGEGRRLVNFGVKTGLTSRIRLWEFAEDGRLISRQDRELPGFAFLHDFALTPNYAVFFQNPVKFNPLPFIAGLKGAGQCLESDRQAPTRILVIPRDHRQPVRTFTMPSCFVFHHANAFEEGGQLVVDSVCYPELPVLDPETRFTHVSFEDYPAGQLWRQRIDLDSGRVERTCLEARTCEFPVVNPAQVGRNARYCWMGVAAEETGNAPLQGIVKLDLHSGRRQHLWSAGPRGYISEPMFVPRPGATHEDDGWVLSLIYNAERHASDLMVLDAADLRVQARVKLPLHIPYGLHGSFVPVCFGEVPAAY
jgi:all-trans-8'-apo-beta-carotenal 15,15'-oxygenase